MNLILQSKLKRIFININKSSFFLGAYVDLKNVVAGQVGSSSAAKQTASAPSGGAFKSDALFAKIQEEVGKNKDLAKSIGAVFLYNITENGKTVKSWSEYEFFIIHLCVLGLWSLKKKKKEITQPHTKFLLYRGYIYKQTYIHKQTRNSYL